MRRVIWMKKFKNVPLLKAVGIVSKQTFYRWTLEDKVTGSVDHGQPVRRVFDERPELLFVGSEGLKIYILLLSFSLQLHGRQDHGGGLGDDCYEPQGE